MYLDSVGAPVLNTPSWSLEVSQLHSSYLILLTLVALSLAAGLFYYIGLIGWVVYVLGVAVRGSIRQGFLLWKRLFAWVPWPLFLALIVGLISLGWATSQPFPGLTVLGGVACLFMGVTACLAYMFIDLERYEVERGYKAVHNPLKGQQLAVDLVQYSHQVGIPLLLAAAVGVIGGFALLNQGLYETVGRDWYKLGEEKAAPGYADFLAYALINLYRIVDLVDLANSYNSLRVRA